MKIRHTPGPWQHDTAMRTATGVTFVTAGSIDARIARNPPSGCAVVVAHVKHDGDGALIAALPELLAALIDIRDSSAYDVAAKVRASIALEKAGVSR